MNPTLKSTAVTLSRAQMPAGDRPEGDRNKGLSTTLRQLRRSARATQADVATALGLERTSVCNIESGIQALTIEKLHDFAECIDADVTVTFRPRKRARAAASARVLSEAKAAH